MPITENRKPQGLAFLFLITNYYTTLKQKMQVLGREKMTEPRATETTISESLQAILNFHGLDEGTQLALISMDENVISVIIPEINAKCHNYLTKPVAILLNEKLITDQAFQQKIAGELCVSNIEKYSVVEAILIYTMLEFEYDHTDECSTYKITLDRLMSRAGIRISSYISGLWEDIQDGMKVWADRKDLVTAEGA